MESTQTRLDSPYQDQSQSEASPLDDLGSLDTIFLRNLTLQATLGRDAWNRPNKAQPIILTIHLALNTSLTAQTDNLAHTFSYGQLCNDITAKIANQSFDSLDHLTTNLASIAEAWPGEEIKISALAPKALLRAEGGFSRDLVLRRQSLVHEGTELLVWHVVCHRWMIRGLKPACVIGVNAHERLEKQIVVLDLVLFGEDDAAAYTSQIGEGQEMWRRLVRRVLEVVEASEFLTVEALVGRVAGVVLAEFRVPKVRVRCEKPSALAFVEGAGVEIERSRES